MKTGMIRKILTSVAKAVLILAITLVLAEAALRVYQVVRPTFIFQEGNTADIERFRGKPYDDVYGYKLNSKGFKDKEYETEKRPGTFRVLGIGDSFVYSIVPYPDNFLTILEDKLNENASPYKDIEILNMGISSAGPEDYVSVLADEGLALSPDMAMVFFYIGNDFVVFLPPESIPKERGPISELYLYKLARYLYVLTSNLSSEKVLSEQYDDSAPTMKDERYNKILSANSDKYKVNDDGTWVMDTAEFWKNEYKYSMDDIKRLSEICRENGISLVLVLIPEDVQVDQHLQAIVKQYQWTQHRNFDFEIPNKLMRRDLEKMGVEYLDLLEPFKKGFREKNKRLYKRNDTHWNIAGNKLAADVLYDYLGKRISSEN